MEGIGGSSRLGRHACSSSTWACSSGCSCADQSCSRCLNRASLCCTAPAFDSSPSWTACTPVEQVLQCCKLMRGPQGSGSDEDVGKPGSNTPFYFHAVPPFLSHADMKQSWSNHCCKQDGLMNIRQMLQGSIRRMPVLEARYARQRPVASCRAYLSVSAAAACKESPGECTLLPLPELFPTRAQTLA